MFIHTDKYKLQSIAESNDNYLYGHSAEDGPLVALQRGGDEYLDLCLRFLQEVFTRPLKDLWMLRANFHLEKLNILYIFHFLNQ